jgi:FAD/FMN-containing dehydrogenase
MTSEWTNWSGSVHLRAAGMARPASEAELVALVREALSHGGAIRAVGSAHSSSGILESEDIVVVTHSLTGIRSCDPNKREAWVGAGTKLKDLGAELQQKGLALHNYGDVDVQTIAGAVATGTHGTGRQLRNLASMLVGARVVTGSGQSREFSVEREPDVIRGLRVSLGALGICTSLRLKLVEAYRLQRREWCATFEPALAGFDELASSCRNVDLYWYPRSDEVKLRTLDEPGRLPQRLPFARLISEELGWASEVLPRTRELRFEEMEYAVPAAAGPACMREVRARMIARHRRHVAWRVLYRTVAADDAYLSTAHGQDIVTISLHHNAGLPFEEFFSDIEPVFRAHGGRPHWAKKHSLSGAELRRLYPEWDRFLALRAQLDPNGVFLSRKMCSLLGVARSAVEC